MESERVLERFRSAVRADIARGGAKPLRSYLRLFGMRYADEITREYAALATDAPAPALGGLSGVRAPDPSTAEAPPPSATRGPSASIGPPSIGLARLGVPLVEKGEIARGGMGAILRVRDETLQRDLAMKVVLAGDETPSRESVLRFVEEARVQARLDHPGVAPIHHLGTDAKGRASFTMKLVEGRSLAEILAASRRGEERANLVKTVQTLLRVCETMAFAHDKGVVHRDLKPANVMVGAFGEVYVMDWGLAKTLGAAETAPGGAAGSASSSASSSGLTQVGAILGTPTYMPPEQAEGRNADVDATSDVYAVGAILYEALAGRAPYQAPGVSRTAVDTLRDVLAGPPPPLAQFAPRGFDELVAVAEKAMARDRSARYPSARELGEDLQRWIEGRVVRAHRTGAWMEFVKWVQRNKAVAASFLAVVAVIVVASARSAALEHDAGLRIAKERDDALEARNDEASARKDAVAAKDDAVKARDDAVAARDEARAAARRADGLRLCTIATMKAGEDATLASLLAYEGARLAPGKESTSALFEALRDFGEERTLVGNSVNVMHGLFSPDGRRVYTGSFEGRVIAWDAASGRELRRVALGRYNVVDLELVDDGRRLFAAALLEPSRLMDADTLATIREFPLETKDGVLGRWDAALSPDRTRLATADWDGGRVFDVATGKELARFKGFGAAYATSVRWSPDGTRVAAGGTDLHVRIWNAASGAQIADFAPPSGATKAPAVEPQNPSAVANFCPVAEWNAEGTRVVTYVNRWNDKARVAVWDAASGARLFGGDAASPWIDLVGVTPDRRRAIVVEAVTGEVRRASYLDLATGGLSSVPWNDSKGYTEWRKPTFSRDGKFVALTSTNVDRYAVAVFSTETGVRLRTYVGHAGAIADVAFSPDGARVLTCSADSYASIWTTTSDAFRAGIALRAPPNTTADVRGMDASGRVVAVFWRRSGGDAPIAAEIADAASGAALRAFDDLATLREAVLSADGARCATVRADAAGRSKIEAIDVASGRALARVEGRVFQELRFDAAGRRLAFRAKEVGGIAADDAAYVLDVESGSSPRRYDNPEPGAASMKLEALALSEDGAKLAASQGYVGAVVWNVATGAVVGHYPGHTGMVMSVAFSPDGTRLASSAMDTGVRIHDVASGATLAALPGLPRKRSLLVWSRDGAVVAAVCPDVCILYDARPGGQELGRIPRPDAQFVFRAAIGADGRLVAAVRDGTTRSWPLDPVAWFASRRPRELRGVEAQMYAVGGDDERFERELKRVETQAAVPDVCAVATQLLVKGRVDDADRLVRRAQTIDPTDYVAAVAAARVAVARRDSDAAFAALRRARDLGETVARYADDPLLAAVRADPRWKELVDER